MAKLRHRLTDIQYAYLYIFGIKEVRPPTWIDFISKLFDNVIIPLCIIIIGVVVVKRVFLQRNKLILVKTKKIEN